ncbi:MAG: hypothetical protein KatS3mg078_0051 [Deltaproteobacteria bacterium]|nr:MAG: hypothetical protein KatS3mg078_0051 [Deltaproteobacteria bacterium]
MKKGLSSFYGLKLSGIISPDMKGIILQRGFLFKILIRFARRLVRLLKRFESSYGRVRSLLEYIGFSRSSGCSSWI